MRALDEIGDVKGKKIIVRGSLNVPIQNGQVINTERIDITLKTVEELREKGAKIILIGHIGRKKEETLEPVMRYIQDVVPVVFIKDIYAPDTQKTIDQVAPGTVILLENLRKWNGEKENDNAFAKLLASFGDIYVNEAFSVCHREHTSIVSLPELLPSFAGKQLEIEVINLSTVFKPKHPFVFILGGAKTETKLSLLERFKETADVMYVGGVLANDFFKAKGMPVAASIVSDITIPKEILESEQVVIPSDMRVMRNGKKVHVFPQGIKENDAIFDIGEASTKKIIEKIRLAKFIVWNGPLGYCEEGFCDATIAIAEALAESKATVIVGGGDTLAAVPDTVQEKIDFVSTGGGAMLQFLAEKTLPGIEALK